LLNAVIQDLGCPRYRLSIDPRGSVGLEGFLALAEMLVN
jgi:hypothetical protein